MSEENKARGTELINVGASAAENSQDKNKNGLKLGEIRTEKDGQDSQKLSDHFNSQDGKKDQEQHSDISVVVEEEDASDLLYDKELKLLLEDHKRVMKFTMLFSMVILFG